MYSQYGNIHIYNLNDTKSLDRKKIIASNKMVPPTNSIIWNGRAFFEYF